MNQQWELENHQNFLLPNKQINPKQEAKIYQEREPPYTTDLVDGIKTWDFIEESQEICSDLELWLDVGEIDSKDISAERRTTAKFSNWCSVRYLEDKYIKCLIVAQTGLKRNNIPIELIKLKRLEVTLKREFRRHNGQNDNQ